MRFNFDVTSLFGGLNSNNSNNLFGGINLSDYSLIKRGGYKKLMKSYYDEQSGKTTHKNNVTTNKKEQAIDKTGLTQMKKESTKMAFDKFCSEIGLSVSSAFNIFAKTVVREQRIPFEITTEVPNNITAAAMNEYDEMQKHPEKYKRYATFKEAMNRVILILI